MDGSLIVYYVAVDFTASTSSLKPMAEHVVAMAHQLTVLSTLRCFVLALSFPLFVG